MDTTQTFIELIEGLHPRKAVYLAARVSGLSPQQASEYLGITTGITYLWRSREKAFKELEDFLVSNSIRYAREAEELLSQYTMQKARTMLCSLVAKADKWDELSSTDKRAITWAVSLLARLEKQKGGSLLHPEERKTYDELVLERQKGAKAK